MIMQIWRLYVTEGILAITHGAYFPIHEMYIPDLGLAVNSHTSFLVKDEDRYKQKDNHPPQKPKLICEVEMTDVQISDATNLASIAHTERRLQAALSKIVEN